MATIFRPVRRAIDLLGSISDSSLIPSGVISNAHENISATGKPKMMTMIKIFITHGGVSKSRKKNRRRLDQEPGNNRISDSHLVNIAPLQLGEEIAQIHPISKLQGDLVH
jgi:hypothetical protein